MKYSVVIVEDQNLPRQFFRSIIDGSERYYVAKEFASDSAVEEYCLTNKPDLILMDVFIGDEALGLILSDRIKKKDPGIRIVVVTQMPEASYLKRAKAIGIDSFWYKDVVGTSLLNIIDRTMQGEHIFPDNPPTVKIGFSDSNCFTERELDVLRILTTGAGDAEIAEKLNISYDTVRTHIKQMQEKTGLSRVRLAIEARAAGIAIG